MELIRPSFVTMGMLIIDEIHYSEKQGRKSEYDVLGGAGTYGVIGARLFSKGERAKEICWIADKGRDFPAVVEKEINSWNTGVIWRYDPNRLTTRGWNSYGENEERAFRYTTTKLRIDTDDLVRHNLDSSRSIHFICSPKRYLKFMEVLRPDTGKPKLESIFIWEPVPDECRPESLPHMIEALQKVDVFTPNAKEAAMFLNQEEPFFSSEIEALALKYSKLLEGTKCRMMVLRCGHLGCLAMEISPSSSRTLKWFPAYHSKENDDFTFEDPTGGGNTFVGGLAAGLVQTRGNLSTACIFANVAAGFAIEQVGLPKLTRDFDRKELWNGVSVEQRVKTYCSRNGFDYPAFRPAD